MKKTLSLILAAATAAAVCTSCGGNERKTARQNLEAAEYIASQTPMEASIFLITGNTGAFSDEWTVFQRAAELTNVSLKGMVSKMNSDTVSAYNLMMASGEIADIVGATKSDIEQYIDQGVYIELENLIDEHAPHIKQFLEENPKMKRGATYTDGKMYFIPFMADGIASTGWYIRKDWLEKLGLEEPKTVEELYSVLKAFRTQDPNGNGIQDEIPYFQRGKTISDLFSLFGVRSNWSVDENNKVIYGQYTKEYKTAIENIAKWYKEGLIDREIYTRASDARAYALQENVGGMTHDWFTSTSSYNESLASKIEGFSFMPIAPPADINGKVWEVGSRSTDVNSGWAITVACKDPVAMIKYMDFWFTEEGRRLANFGIEGDTYTMVDGKPTFTEKMFEGDTTVLQKLWKIGAQIPSGMGYHQDYYYEQQTLSEEVNSAIQMYIDGGYIAEQMPNLTFTAEEQEIINNKLPSIKTYADETEQQWVMGAKDVASSFDEYMQNMKKMGIEDVIAVYNAAYERYMNN